LLKKKYENDMDNDLNEEDGTDLKKNEEVKLDMQYNRALMNLRMRIEQLEPSINRLYDPKG